MKRTVFSFFLLCFFASESFFASPLTDPQIPDGEWMRLSVLEGEKSSVMQGRLSSEDTDGGIYTIITMSERETLKLSIKRHTMIPFYVQTTRKGKDFSMTTSSLIEGNPTLDDDEIRMLDTTGLIYSLRGYPFTRPRELEITFFSANEDNGSNFRLSVDLDGKETLSVANRQIFCYRLELSFEMSGMFAVFARMTPKTKIWYSVDPPHYLVRYQGQNGPPGTPLTIIELLEYSGWKE